MKARRGFAFIAVLWLTAGIATALLDLTLRFRHRRLATLNTVERIQLRAAVDGALELGLALVAQWLASVPPDTLERPVFPPALHERRIGDVTVVIMMEDARAGMNLNTAPRDNLVRFFAQFGIDGDRAADALLDWIDADDDDRSGGSERARYAAAGLPTRPPNRWIVEPWEICGIPDIGADACRRAVPFIGRLSDNLVNINTAPREVLLSLPGFTHTTVDRLFADRAAGLYARTLPAFGMSLDHADRFYFETHLMDLLRQATTDTGLIRVQAVARGTTEIEVSAALIADVSRGRVDVVGRWRK